MLTVGSLFSGIGGLDLGLERAGMEVRWQVEIEDYPTRVLEKHWPDVKRYRDVREVGMYNLERVDLICGGFPCQDISIAGKGAGIEGDRSGLWKEFHRIIGELRPRYVLIENVAALLTRGGSRVLGDLASLGYDASWDCIPAAAVGAPHRRDRAFVIAYPSGWRCKRVKKRDIRPEANINTLYRRDIDRLDVAQRCAKEAASRIRGMDDVLPFGVDRLKGLGNAVVPQVAEYIGRLIMRMEGEGK